MQLLELFVQTGAGNGRLPLRVGHNLVRSARPLLPLLERLLYPDGDTPIAGSDGAKVALVARAADGVVWRLVSEAPGACALQRYDEATRRYVAVEASSAEIGPWLRSQAGLPGRTAFRELLSLADAAGSGAGGAPAPGREERIAQLEAELRTADRIDQLQRRLDEILHRQVEVQREGEGYAHLQKRVGVLREELRSFDVLGDLPDDISPLIASWEKAGAELDGAMRRIEAERAKIEARTERGEPEPLWRDPIFCVAFAVGLVALLVGLFSPLRILALLDVPAFGVAAWVAIRQIGRQQTLEQAGRLASRLVERERKAQAAWEEATASLRATMARLEISDPRELQERVRERAAARERLAQAEAERDARESEHAALEARLQELGREAAAIEEELSGLVAGAYRARETVESELAALRGGPALAASIPGALAAQMGRRDEGPQRDPARLLEHAAEMTGVPAAELAKTLSQRVGVFLAALTERRWASVELSASAGMWCSGPGVTSPFAELAPADRRMALLALQLAAIEHATASRPLPVVFDDPFGFVDPARRQLVARMLQGVGRRAQVVHRTRVEGFEGHADATAELP